MKPLQTFHKLSPEKRERITEAAVAEFGEKGYAGASINALVDRLGIAKGSIFQYFGDKRGLFLFVFHTAMERVKAYLRSVRDQTVDQDIFSRLRATLLAGVAFLHAHPAIYRLYIKILFEYDMPLRERLLRSLREYSLSYLRGLLADARRRGELRADLDIDTAAFALDAVMDRFLQAQAVPFLDAGLGLHGASPAVAEAWVDRLMDLLKKGLGGSGDAGGCPD